MAGTDGGGGAADRWVQCDKCSKWRRLPPHVSEASLPDAWTCAMADWNPAIARCDAPEEASESAKPAFAPPSLTVRLPVAARASPVPPAGPGAPRPPAAPPAAPSAAQPVQAQGAPAGPAAAGAGASAAPAAAAATATATATAAPPPVPGLAGMRRGLVELAASLNEASAVLKRYREDSDAADGDFFGALNRVIGKMRAADEFAKSDASGELGATVPYRLFEVLNRGDGENDPSLFTAEVLQRAAGDFDRLSAAQAALLHTAARTRETDLLGGAGGEAAAARGADGVGGATSADAA